MSETNLTPRERKAVELIRNGAISLVLGQSWATVRGSGQAVYKVSKAGCECQDWQKRGEQVGACKHMRALKALCDIARLCREEARTTGRTRIPAPLALALANGAASQRRRAALVENILFVPSDLSTVAV